MRSGRRLGASRGCLLERLGGFLEPRGGILEHLGGDLDRLGNVLGRWGQILAPLSSGMLVLGAEVALDTGRPGGVRGGPWEKKSTTLRLDTPHSRGIPWGRRIPFHPCTCREPTRVNPFFLPTTAPRLPHNALKAIQKASPGPQGAPSPKGSTAPPPQNLKHIFFLS